VAGPTYSYPRCKVALTVLDEDWDAGTAVTHTIMVTPREVEWERNDARTADTARIVLDYKDFPMDPRIVRSCQVRILCGNAPTWDGALTEADAVWFGFLDAPESARDETGATVTLECRDNTALFIDHIWQDGLIDISKGLGDVIAGIVALVPSADGLTVGYSVGVNAAVLATKAGKTKFAPQKNDNAWTVITELCDIVGLVPVVQMDMLLILNSDDFGVDRATFLASDVLTPQTAAFVYGENLSRLVLRRSFKQARQRQIEVRCWDPAKGVATIARYPVAAIVTSKKVSAAGKVTTEQAPILPYFVTGSHTPSDLAALAENIWKQAAREEIEVTATTKEMNPQLGNGARVTVTVSPSLVTDVAGLSPGEALAKLTTGPRALAPDVAQAFVSGAQTAGNLAVDFYARNIKHKWSREQGYSCEMTLINYLGGTH